MLFKALTVNFKPNGVSECLRYNAIYCEIVGSETMPQLWEKIYMLQNCGYVLYYIWSKNPQLWTKIPLMHHFDYVLYYIRSLSEFHKIIQNVMIRLKVP